MLSERYPSADVRATLETIRGLLLAVETVFGDLEHQVCVTEADTLGWELEAARGACALVGRVIADEAMERPGGTVMQLR